MDSPDRQFRVTLIVLLRSALREMVDELVARLADRGYPDVRAAYSPVFENIDPDGTRLTRLAERAGMSHPSMSELVGNIERLGYVERLPDPADGRARLIRLTRPGRALQRQALTEIADIEAEWLRRLGPVFGSGLRDALAGAVADRGDDSDAARGDGD